MSHPSTEADQDKKDSRAYEATNEPNIFRLVQPDGRGQLFFRKKVKGKKFFRALETAEMRDAKKRAKDYMQWIIEGRWEKLRGAKKRSAWASLPEIYEAYLATSTIKTKKNVVGSMRYVVRVGGGDPEGSVEQLDAKLVWAFQQAMKKRAEGQGPLVRLRAERSADSYVRQARQIFAEALLPAYSSFEFPAHVLDRARDPNTRGFMTAVLLDPPAVQYVAPPATVINRINSAYPQLRYTDAGAYVAFLLGAFLGLRNNEVAASRWDWVEPDGRDKTKFWLKIRISEDYGTKTLKPRDVEIPASVMAELVALRGAETFDKVPGDKTFLVPAPHMTDRSDRVFRRLNKWLRDQGLSEEMFSKGFYELRKHFGDVQAWSGGTYRAARALGNSPEVAERYYTSAEGRAPVQIDAPKVSTKEIQKAAKAVARQVAA